MKDINEILPALKDINPYLLSGGAGALATGIAASKIKRDPKKSRLADLGRKLTITLGGGLAAAGAHKALNMAGEAVSTALPKDDISTEQKIVNTATNPNTIRALSGVGTISALSLLGTRRDKAVLKDFNTQFNGKLNNVNPVKSLRDILTSSSGEGNKLENYIQTLVDGNPSAVKPKELDKLNEMKKELKDLTKPRSKKGAPILPGPTEQIRINELSEEIDKLQRVVDADALNIREKSINAARSQLADAGFNSAHYDPAKPSKFRAAVSPYLTRVTGRSPVGKVLKPLAIAGSVFSPEVFDLGSRLLNSNPEE